MTPLAAKVANELTLPKAKRTFDDAAHVLDLFDQDMHCFEVSALAKSVNAVLDDPLASEDEDAAWSVWRDIGSMLPNMFLPSPVTWLEMLFNGSRVAMVVREKGAGFELSTVHQSGNGNFSLHMCDFRARGILEPGERIDVQLGELDALTVPDDPVSTRIVKEAIGTGAPKQEVERLRKSLPILQSRLSLLQRRIEIGSAGIEVMSAASRFIGMVVLTLDLINTPGLIGLRQRDVNRGLAKRLSNVGRYPLHAWSEVVLKHETKLAQPGERVTGATYHKCLHFVRSHLRHYRDGRVTLIPAHWRGDPALGIKRTRYTLAA